MLSLVSIAENSDTSFWNYYNYIENIGDNRGYTISIAGFCTGTGDFSSLLQQLQIINPNHPLCSFIGGVQASDKGDVSQLTGLDVAVKNLGNDDKDFNTAVWMTIKSKYWDTAYEYFLSKKLKSLLAFYIIYDTNINFGEMTAFESINACNSEKDETNFLNQFLQIKQTTIEKDTTLGEGKYNRVDMQKSLLSSGNFDLHTPMNLNCYQTSFTL